MTSLQLSQPPVWCRDLGAVPATRPAPHPLQDRAALAAWRDVSAEPVLDQRYLVLPDDTGDAQLIAYSLVASSPNWTGWEQRAAADPVWSGPVAYTPTTYAGYGRAGLCCTEHAEQTIHLGLEQAVAWGAPALVLPHLPLDAAEVAIRAAAPDAELHVNTAYSTTVHPLGAAGTLAMNPNRRAARDLGRQLRRASEAGLHLQIDEGASLNGLLPRFAELAAQVDLKHQTAKFGPDVVAALASAPGAMLLSGWHRGRMVGAALAFRTDTTLFLSTAGLDYTHLRDLHTYNWMLAQGLDYAARAGLATVDFGRSNHDVKRRWGFTPTPLRTLVYLTDADDARTREALTGLDRGLRRAASGQRSEARQP